MNPGKIIPTQGLLDNLRMNPEIVPLQIDTQFDFSKEDCILRLISAMETGSAVSVKVYVS